MSDQLAFDFTLPTLQAPAIRFHRILCRSLKFGVFQH